jgi:hypothetical protein
VVVALLLAAAPLLGVTPSAVVVMEDKGAVGAQTTLSPSCINSVAKKYHTAMECWHRFDESYTQDQKFTNAATNSYNIDTNWYMDLGATDHITDELEKLFVRNKYQGGDQIHMTSGADMYISDIGHATINTPHRPTKLKNILYVPRTSKNLIFIHLLTFDNSIFIDLHPFFFLIKDYKTKRILLK